MTLLTAFPRDPPHEPRNLWQGLKLVANMAVDLKYICQHRTSVSHKGIASILSI